MIAESKKVTMYLPQKLLENAMESTGKGITETVKEALESIVAKNAMAELRKYRGKVDLGINIDESREDKLQW